MKELQITINIGEADLNRKKQQMIDFLKDKHQVKLICKMRGRQNQTPQRAIDLLNSICNPLPNKKNGLPKHAGKSVSVIVMP